MGKLKYLIIHGSDTPSTMDVTGDDIRLWHMSPKPKGRGWDRVGYSDLIHIDGTLENLTQYDEDQEVEAHEMTWGVKGVNAVSRHICYAGGRRSFGLKNLKSAQFLTLQRYIKAFLHHHPDAQIAGHNQFSTKECPGFDTIEFCTITDIPERNIYRG